MKVTGTVISDASLCHETKAGGWAVWVRVDGGIRIQQAGPFKRRPDNATEAELWAAINGLTIAYKAGATEVLLQTDSLNVVQMVQRNKQSFTGHLRRLGIKLRVRAKHVKGHTRVQDARSHCNRWCDKEARRHMKQQRKELSK